MKSSLLVGQAGMRTTSHVGMIIAARFHPDKSEQVLRFQKQNSNR